MATVKSIEEQINDARSEFNEIANPTDVQIQDHLNRVRNLQDQESKTSAGFPLVGETPAAPVWQSADNQSRECKAPGVEDTIKKVKAETLPGLPRPHTRELKLFERTDTSKQLKDDLANVAKRYKSELQGLDNKSLEREKTIKMKRIFKDLIDAAALLYLAKHSPTSEFKVKGNEEEMAREIARLDDLMRVQQGRVREEFSNLRAQLKDEFGQRERMEDRKEAAHYRKETAEQRKLDVLNQYARDAYAARERRRLEDMADERYQTAQERQDRAEERADLRLEMSELRSKKSQDWKKQIQDAKTEKERQKVIAGLEKDRQKLENQVEKRISKAMNDIANKIDDLSTEQIEAKLKAAGVRQNAIDKLTSTKGMWFDWGKADPESVMGRFTNNLPRTEAKSIADEVYADAIIEGDKTEPPKRREVRRQYSPSRNQTKIFYSDGTQEVVDGKR